MQLKSDPAGRLSEKVKNAQECAGHYFIIIFII